jgi:predicted metal-binding membrane protein
VNAASGAVPFRAAHWAELAWTRSVRRHASFPGAWSAVLESLRWRYPEWWTIALSAAAWGVLVAQELAGPGGHHQLDQAAPGGLSAWLQHTGSWLLMVLAMMLPLVLFSVRVTAVRSVWRRRDRAIGGFLMGYLSPWLLAGALIAVLDVTLGLDRWLQLLPWLGGVGFGGAALWQLSPIRLRALRACHRTLPIAPRGWRADRDCFRFGWLIGGQCLVSCWALMVACVLAGHSLAAMVPVGGLGVAERYFMRPRQRALFSPLLGIALAYGILGVSALQSL